ncbi:uncharacterized protein LOC132707410 isoform X1 [Cylas formicarius]|uniref:uncharacterized protein LOC132707410 isoform X1 n=1 Tax=Cylas formicarius TaxID=197179 RepID=UPI0029584EB9|nr:uncharacterized protein LOC132707410 isoform X1 [Cylas formicarius]
MLTRILRCGTTSMKRPSTLLYLLALTLVPIVVLSLIVLAAYRHLVRLLLVLRHGDKFGGMFEGADMVWAIQEKEWRSILSIILVLESDTKMDMRDRLRKIAEERVFHTTDYPKLSSTRHHFLGYTYMLRNTYTAEEGISLLKIPENKPFDESALNEVASEVCNSPLDKEDTAMWALLVSPIPLAQKNEGKYLYPIILRFSHAVGDGVTYVSFLIKIFSNGSISSYLQDHLKKAYANSEQSAANWYTVLKDGVSKFVNFAYFLFIFLGLSIYHHSLRDFDKHELHGRILTGDKIATWSCEETAGLVPTVRRIKNRVPGGKFSSVVLTALSASLTDFFKRNRFDTPERITLAAPLVLSYRLIFAEGPIPLTNNFSMVIFPLDTVRSTLIDTMQKTIDQSELLSTLPDPKAMMLFQYISGVIPMPLLKKLLTIPGVTMCVSNVPATSKLQVFDQCNLKHIVFFPQHREKLGLSVGICTYDDRFQIGLMVDKALISSPQEAQKITDDVFKYIRQLDLETNRMYPN